MRVVEVEVKVEEKVEKNFESDLGMVVVVVVK